MKTLVAIVISLLAVAHIAQAEVKEEQDRFTGETTFSYQSELSTPAADEMLGPPTLIALATYKEGTVSYSMMLSTSSDIDVAQGRSWRYLDVTKINWLVDGARTVFADPLVDRRTGGGFVMETFIVDFTPEQLQQLAASKSVEFRIGLDEFSLSTADISALGEILNSRSKVGPTS